MKHLLIGLLLLGSLSVLAQEIKGEGWTYEATGIKGSILKDDYDHSRGFDGEIWGVSINCDTLALEYRAYRYSSSTAIDYKFESKEKCETVKNMLLSATSQSPLKIKLSEGKPYKVLEVSR